MSDLVGTPNILLVFSCTGSSSITDVPVASTDQQIWNEPEPIVSHDPNCEVCLDKGVLAGVAVFVVFVIVLTNAASVYLYLRGRGRFVKGGAVGPGKEKNKEAM